MKAFLNSLFIGAVIAITAFAVLVLVIDHNIRVPVTSKPIIASPAAHFDPTVSAVASSTMFLPTEPQFKGEWARKLAAKAKARHLHWRIWCTGLDRADSKFGASAWRDDDEFGRIYFEDGAQPKWLTWGPTQEKAAYYLNSYLDAAPNDLPEHKPSESAPRKCKEPLIGDQE